MIGDFYNSLIQILTEILYVFCGNLLVNYLIVYEKHFFNVFYSMSINKIKCYLIMLILFNRGISYTDIFVS